MFSPQSLEYTSQFYMGFLENLQRASKLFRTICAWCNWCLVIGSPGVKAACGGFGSAGAVAFGQPLFDGAAAHEASAGVGCFGLGSGGGLLGGR